MMRWRFLASPIERVRCAALAAGLTLALAGLQPAEAAARFDCVIEPSRFVKIGSPVTGILESVPIQRGERVKQGQVLARLEARVEMATVALQKLRSSDEAGLNGQWARLSLAQQRMDRTAQLFKRGMATEASHDEVIADLEINRADFERLDIQRRLAGLELERAEAILAQRTIKSPIDGIVVRRTLSPGEFVNQDAHIAEIADLDPLHVEVFLPVAYYPQIAKNDTGIVRPAEPISGAYTATVSVVDRVFDATSNTFGVRLILDNADSGLPAGQRCSVEFDIEAIDVVGTGFTYDAGQGKTPD